MAEVALARLWHLPDGTSCLLFKDSTAETWRIRIVRGDVTLRSEEFTGPLIAMSTAKVWRAQFDPSFEASH